MIVYILSVFFRTYKCWNREKRKVEQLPVQPLLDETFTPRYVDVWFHPAPARELDHAIRHRGFDAVPEMRRIFPDPLEVLGECQVDLEKGEPLDIFHGLEEGLERSNFSVDNGPEPRRVEEAHANEVSLEILEAKPNHATGKRRDALSIVIIIPILHAPLPRVDGTGVVGN